ncbi:SUPPRESSOR OF GAMMA RESPONSE 1-like [Daucus carota subsp. sativus]|uniref:SUPPRESSOR OF GAMMA RESPONSE 1-like n=1 Tax=Daucus carota subsp. sativus TaxID=79200 RepID=UPI0007EFA5F9|nr:PREDICTED: NAC domain-containing protein 8-like [Daucus carota subsp. sativus]
MARSWLVDGRAIARKVKHATLPFADQIKDCGVKRECPNCFYCIDNSDVSHAWPGLPAGVKFDPSDVQILEHLAAKCGVGESDPHMFIDEFIPTLDMENGICYTHPENLPGAKEDGTSVYFFHKTANAYATGQRKRRKIQNEDSSGKEHVRWHKTGKTKPVLENGTQKGSKKIMVLYRSAVNGSKPEKSNWVMHQYHLGTEEDEKDGDYVVSRIFYQHQKQGEKIDGPVAITESNKVMLHTSPKTPKTNTPNPPRPGNSGYLDDIMDEFQLRSSTYEAEYITEMNKPSSDVHLKDGIDDSYLAGESQAVVDQGAEFVTQMNEPFSDVHLKDDIDYSDLVGKSQAIVDQGAAFITEMNQPSDVFFRDNIDYPYLAGESQDVHLDGIEDSLLCDEIFESSALYNNNNNSGLCYNSSSVLPCEVTDASGAANNESCGIPDLDDIDLDTPPDFQLSNLQFGSQDSIFDLLDRL